MAEIGIDPRGRLVRLSVAPPAVRENAAPAPPTDWSRLFREASLDIGRFTPVPPKWSPRGYATERAAWEGPHPDRPGVTMRVEAASYEGRPISFLWLGPWTEPERPGIDSASTTSGLVFEGILFLCIVGGNGSCSGFLLQIVITLLERHGSRLILFHQILQIATCFFAQIGKGFVVGINRIDVHI